MGWAQQTHYVKWDAAGANNGANWTDAYTSLDAALVAASSGDEIWVAGSLSPSMAVYSVPAGGFQLKEGVDVFGGFEGLPGQEDDFDERDPDTYSTHLDGGSSERVLQGMNIATVTEINGFIIENGSSPNDGGGILINNCLLRIIDCTIRNNTAADNGGGIAITTSGTSVVTLAGCDITGNTATALEGGGVFIGAGEELRMRGCFLLQNTAGSGGGGISAADAILFAHRCGLWDNRTNSIGGAGMLLSGGTANLANIDFREHHQDVVGAAIDGAGVFSRMGNTGVLVNARFYDNIAGPGFTGNGGGACLDNSTLQLVNCSFANNTGGASGGGGLHVTTGTATVDNCLFEGNTGGSGSTEANQLTGTVTMNNSVVEGYSGGGSNSDIGPAGEFMSPTEGNFSLSCAALAREFGNSLALPADVWDMDRDGDTAEPIPYDFDENERIQGTVNAGAHEDEIIVYVDQSAAGTGTGDSWSNAYTELHDAMNFVPGSLSCPVQYWVASGTYLPDAGANRSASFVLDDNEEIFGGFAGGEIYLDAAEPATNQTILSGDIGITNDPADNSYHVISADGVNDNTATLYGVIVENGNANGGGGR